MMYFLTVACIQLVAPSCTQDFHSQRPYATERACRAAGEAAAAVLSLGRPGVYAIRCEPRSEA